MKNRFKRWTAFLLIGMMLFLQGCSGGENNTPDSVRAPKTSADGGSEEKSMGRYLEEEIILPEDLSVVSYPQPRLQKLDSGELAVIEPDAGMYVSADNGENWNRKDTSWMKELRNAYVSDIVIAPNGAVAVVYSPHSDEVEESSEEDSSFRPQYLYVDPEGNTKMLESPEQENAVYQFWFGKDSRLYAYTMGSKVYEMDPQSGETKMLFETEGMTDYVCFTDKYMVVITSRGVTLYDMEAGVLAEEDQVFQKFLTEEVGDIGSTSGEYSVVAAQGDQEDVIYFACSSGLYRHVIGGTALEQIVEGSLSSMGDPMMGLAGIAVLPDNEFAVLYTNAKLYHYVYDPDVPTVPDQQIGVYSLKENYTIRQAVSLFQKQHPEVYVRYEIGMTEGSGMTSEDAVKNLNTRLMSGSGPDLLVLDGLPGKSYQEKGVLMELSELAESLTGEDQPFSNLTEACREDGKLWYLPVRFRLPILMGNPEMIAEASDLTALADALEKLRAENPEGALTGLSVEEDVLRTLGITCSAVWTDPETGAINEEKLTEFLEQAKRIYEAEIAGLEEKELEEKISWYQERRSWAGFEDYYASASSAALNIAMKAQKAGVGTIDMVDGDFNMISTVANQEENIGYTVWQGQIQNGFIPKCMVGICSSSADNELAVEFFRFLYGRELQDIETSNGFPVNQASFESLKENPRDEDMGISIGTSDADGNSFGLDVKWSGEEDFTRLKNMAESAASVCLGDTAIEQAVYEIGPKALNGSASAEETVAEIVKKAAIYLAE